MIKIAMLIVALTTISGCATRDPIMVARPINVYVNPDVPNCQFSAIMEAIQFWRSIGVNINDPILNLNGKYHQQPGSITIVDGSLQSFGASGATWIDTFRGEINSAKIVIDVCHEEIVAHEIGHALGLNHNDEQGSLMYGLQTWKSTWYLFPYEIETVAF